MPLKAKKTKKKVGIALQGGESHGAFAWGVLDCLLEENCFDMVGFSGTSAGGMNAACVLQGLIKGTNKTARVTLKDFWHKLHELSKKTSPYISNPFDKKQGYYNLDCSPGYLFMTLIQSYFSLYQLNPMNFNPFRILVEEFFDFHAIQTEIKKRIFLATTHVKTGKIKIFSNEDCCTDVLMASACLPSTYHAVQINRQRENKRRGTHSH
ncbi:MAG: patatin-like phospholipase family protein [Alphaproteobacteria bacterium]